VQDVEISSDAQFHTQQFRSRPVCEFTTYSTAAAVYIQHDGVHSFTQIEATVMPCIPVPITIHVMLDQHWGVRHGIRRVIGSKFS